jgi:hypothetical protein
VSCVSLGTFLAEPRRSSQPHKAIPTSASACTNTTRSLPSDPSLSLPSVPKVLPIATSSSQRLGCVHPATPGTTALTLVDDVRPALVEIRIEANALSLRKPDVFAVVYASHATGGVELGRTETVFSNADPSFYTRFIFSYTSRSRPTNVLIELFERGSSNEAAPLSSRTFLGRADFIVCPLFLSTSGGRQTAPMRRGGTIQCGIMQSMRSNSSSGTISLIAERIQDPADCCGIGTTRSGVGIIVFRLDCAALRQRNAFGILGGVCTMSYEVAREREESDGSFTWTTVYRSRAGRRVNADGYCQFPPAVLDEVILHNSCPERQLRITIFKQCAKAGVETVCYAQTSAAQLSRIGCGSSQFPSDISSYVSLKQELKRNLGEIPMVQRQQDGGGPADSGHGTLGWMRITGMKRDPTRNDTVVIDLRADISLPQAMTSSCDVRKKLGSSARIKRSAVALQ